MPLPVLLTAVDNDAVRSAIRADLTAAEMPDVVVQSAFTTAAGDVFALDPNAGAWPAGSDEETRAHDAAVFYAAAFLAPSIPQITRESFQGYSYAVQPVDPYVRAEMLRQMAIALLAQNLNVDLISLIRPTVATLAPGGRGDVSDSSYSDFRIANPYPF